MLIGLFCFIVFLFILFQLAKEDFIFLRKGVVVEDVFNAVFLSLPVVFLFSRIAYVVEHPSWRYLNPLIFFLIPYFPGLSFVGAVVGVWIFSTLYIERKKMPTKRLLDMVSISFLFSFSIWVLLLGVTLFLKSKVMGLEEVGRSMLGIALSIFILIAFVRSKWKEGSITYITGISYCVLTGIAIGISLLGKAKISFISLLVTGILFVVFLLLFLRNERFFLSK